MEKKYIYKNKSGKWAVATSKTGKSIRNSRTQKEAIEFAKNLKSTKTIIVKRKSGWIQLWSRKLNDEIAIKPKTVSKPKNKNTVTKKIDWKEREEEVESGSTLFKDEENYSILTVDDTDIKHDELEEKEATLESRKKGIKNIPGWVKFILGFLLIGLVVTSTFLIGLYAL